MSQVLIVGYGFTAWSIDSALEERGYDVHGLRRDWDDPSKNSYSATQWTGDITQPETLEALDLEPDVVVNCVSSGDRGNTERYRDVYLEGGRNLLEWSQGRDVDTVLYTGSSTVYGDRGGDWVDETDSLSPESASGEVLAETEQMYEKTHRETNLDTIVCRLTGIYGPGRQRVIDRYRRGTTTLKGGGDRYRNMVRREDVGEGIALIIDGDPDHRVYNVTDNQPVRERDFYDWLSDQLDGPEPTITDEPLRRSSKRVSNDRLTDEFGEFLRYPTFREGYAPIIETVHP
jgi:nucleoside-diphosphate-sugar epimerase